MTNTCDHNLISFKSKIESQKVINAKRDSYDFERDDFEKSIITCLKTIGPHYITSQKNLQHFSDQLIRSIQTSIKRFTPINFKYNKSKKYPSHIKKLLKEKLIL